MTVSGGVPAAEGGPDATGPMAAGAGSPSPSAVSPLLVAGDPGTASPPPGVSAPLPTGYRNVREALKGASSFLGERGDAQPEISARWIVGAVAGCDPGQLALVSDEPFPTDSTGRLREMLVRRAAGEPLQYICGHAPFRRLNLLSRPGVFIPRAETEVLVQVVLDHLSAPAAPSAPEVLDLCCGSGAVCVSVASEAPAARVTATDVSKEACELTRENARMVGVRSRVEVFQGDLMGPILGLGRRFDVLVSNPPYIPTYRLESMPAEVVDWEPLAALDGGDDGLDVLRRILADASRVLRPGAFLAFELFEDALEAAADLARSASWIESESVSIARDLAGRDRILVANRIG